METPIETSIETPVDTLQSPGHAPPRHARATTATTSAPGAATRPGAGALLEPAVGCPFQLVIGQLAQAAVQQHVLHLTGELLPRADLVARLDGWHDLYRLIRLRVCPATRVAPLTPAELDVLFDAAFSTMSAMSPITPIAQATPPGPPAPIQARLRAQLAACATCASTQQCPLDLAP